MRNFYISYIDDINLAPLVREISRSKNIVIMEKCKEIVVPEKYLLGMLVEKVGENLD